MMSENEFWKELDRLLLQEDLKGAFDLVNEHLEDFHKVLEAKYEKYEFYRQLVLH